MSIRHLKTFLAVARLGTFAAAAKEVGLTQAAVGIQMRGLESEFGVRVFDRTGRAALLNATGRELVTRAMEIVHLYDDLPAAVSGGAAGGVLKIGAIPPTFAQVLPEALLRLKRDHPRLDVRVVNGVSSELTARVEQGELDAALVAEPSGRLASNLTWRAVLREPLVLLTPSDDKPARLQPFLEGRPFIRVSRASWTGRLIDDVLRRFDLKVTDVMELDSLETIRAMVGRGFGVSVLPLAESRWNEDPCVRIWPLVDPVLYRNIGLIDRDGTGKNRSTAALRACFQESPRRGVRRRRAATSISW